MTPPKADRHGLHRAAIEISIARICGLDKFRRTAPAQGQRPRKPDTELLQPSIDLPLSSNLPNNQAHRPFHSQLSTSQDLPPWEISKKPRILSVFDQNGISESMR